MPRRKCFISYHHNDQAEVDAFIRTFDHAHDVFVARGLGQEMTPDVINSNNTDYVMRRIRELYLAGSSVTIVLVGRCTWSRRYVDWEIQASLQQGLYEKPNGLLAIKLPSFPDNGTFPDRLNANLNGTDNCFARWIPYPSLLGMDVLWTSIEAAYQRRDTHSRFIMNSRERYINNRQC